MKTFKLNKILMIFVVILGSYLYFSMNTVYAETVYSYTDIPAEQARFISNMQKALEVNDNLETFLQNLDKYYPNKTMSLIENYSYEILRDHPSFMLNCFDILKITIEKKPYLVKNPNEFLDTCNSIQKELLVLYYGDKFAIGFFLALSCVIIMIVLGGAISMDIRLLKPYTIDQLPTEQI